ncbi:hypothetical protein Tco_0941365 [Tanacetum coccineum]|uniref:Reverse transcriptase domain-containing protein n=1 Tax=Tanacetum coccineum TaxID=301880 RepID=A0ABQ5DR46_9ASTR
MSSPNHPTSDIVDVFSSNFPDYTLTLPNYLLATPGNISSDFLENSKNDEIPPVFSPFYNNPYVKDMQAFYSKEPPIPLQDLITPPAILTPSPIYELGNSSIKMRVKHHEEQIESILDYLEELSFHYIEKIEERLVNDWIIIPRDFDEVKAKLKEARTQILELQKKHMGQRDKISFVHFRISDLEMTLEDIQDRHQLYMKNLMGHTLMPPKRTSTSATPIMTPATIRKLVADIIVVILEEVANTTQRLIDQVLGPLDQEYLLLQGKCTYETFMSCQSFYFNGTEGSIGLIRWFETKQIG